MVTTDGVGGQSGYAPTGSRPEGRDTGTALAKLKHLTSGLTGTVTKTPQGRAATAVDGSISSSSSSSSAGLVHQQSVVSIEDRSLLQKVWDRREQYDPADLTRLPPTISTPTAPSVGGVLGATGSGGAASPLTSPTGGKPGGDGIPIPMRPGRDPGSSCRVCVKSLKEKEFYKICDECGNKVCEDCASYSSTESNEGEDKWNCSICRRRLLSRPPKMEKLPSIDGPTLPTVPPIMASPLPPPSPGAPTALNLLATMASSMGVNKQQQGTSNLPPNLPITMLSAKPPDSLSTDGGPLANGYNPNYRRRSVWAVLPQKSVEKPKTLERSKSKDDSGKEAKTPLSAPPDGGKRIEPIEFKTPSSAPPDGSRRSETKEHKMSSSEGGRRPDSKEHKTSEGGRRPDGKEHRTSEGGRRSEYKEHKTPEGGRRPRDRSRERPAGAPRRAAADDDHLRPSSRMNATRHRRMSDYRLHDAADGGVDHLGVHGNKLHAASSEMDISRVRRKSCHSILMHRPQDPAGGNRMVNGEDANMAEKWRKARRQSIRRQRSCDEDDKENKDAHNILSPWAGGEPPPRRHSMQGPTRREEALEAHKRAKASLDASPYGAKDSSQSVTSGGGSDVTIEQTGEKVSSSGAHEEDLKHVPRPSTSRRGSYIPSRGTSLDKGEPTEGGGDVQSTHTETAPTNTSSVTDVGSTVVASSIGGSTGTLRRTGSTNLEDEWRERDTTRRRASAVYDTGRRFQPLVPSTQTSAAVAAPQPTESLLSRDGARRSRLSQSMEVNQSCDVAGDGPQRQSSVSDGESIRIVIHDVDVERKELDKGKRLVKIQRDMTDPGHRTRGLGMRVVGGKVGPDRRLFAYVVWVVRGGPAHTAGVAKGDKVLKWNGVELTDRSFEEVCSIMEEASQQEEAVELLLESSNDLSSLDSTEEPSALPQQPRRGSQELRRGSQEFRRGSLEPRTPSDPESDMIPTTSSIRRKLPQIPGDLMREPVSGKLQVQIWYDQDKSHLIATVVSAHDLRFRDPMTFYPPEAFVCLRLYPYSDFRFFSTGVAESSCKPLWNSSFIWEGLEADLLLGLTLELTVYDYVSEGEKGFLGETLIDLRHAYLDERPIWYRLQERRSRSANATPRGSIVSHDFPIPIFRRPSSARSGSEDINEGLDSRSSSLDSGLLHPDLAYNHSRSSSRRSSTFSEQGDIEEYQLGRRYPHSMPQSRRSSMSYTSNASLEIKAEDLEARLAVMSPVERRRSHSFRTSTGGEFLIAVEEQLRPRRASSHSILVRSAGGSGRTTPFDPRLWKGQLM